MLLSQLWAMRVRLLLLLFAVLAVLQVSPARLRCTACDLCGGQSVDAHLEHTVVPEIGLSADQASWLSQITPCAPRTHYLAGRYGVIYTESSSS